MNYQRVDRKSSLRASFGILPNNEMEHLNQIKFKENRYNKSEIYDNTS